MYVEFNDHICDNCNRVIKSRKEHVICNHCNQKMRIFDFKKDYYQLVSTSNAYAEIRNRWINHPLLEEISEKLHKENCCGASSHFNAFIEYLEETCIELNRVIEENHKEKLYSMKTTKGESHDFY